VVFSQVYIRRVPLAECSAERFIWTVTAFRAEYSEKSMILSTAETFPFDGSARSGHLWCQDDN